MDPWKESAAWQECREVVRQWAELEGTSPQMTEDLVRDFAEQTAHTIDKPLLLAAGVRAAAWAIQTWWHILRR
jgi:hypothetical protein